MNRESLDMTLGESRCPAHRSLDRALSITRNEFNHVVLTCLSVQNCTHVNVIRALGSTTNFSTRKPPTG